MNKRISTDTFTIEDAMNLYGIDSWGSGYFSVNELGHLVVQPKKNPGFRIDVPKVIEELRKSRMSCPILLRFPQILETQVTTLIEAFNHAISEFSYREGYFPVFPIKVNQQNSVVRTLMQAGYKHRLGLEVGSKAELLVALSIPSSGQGLMICNGFKDREYLETACMGSRMGRNMMVVIEKPYELDDFLSVVEGKENVPGIGIRIKLNAKGSGLWEKSGGGASKFGLSTAQLLESIEKLRAKGKTSLLKMFHFHIGSQITEIRRLKDAFREGARIYAKARKMGIPIEYLNVGGGLGIDYDGSKTSSDASVNYTLEEYANDVVYMIADVCENEHVPHPKIVSESGRAMVAYHSVLVTDVRGSIECTEGKKPIFTGNEPRVIEDLRYIMDEMTVKNYREFYHDAVERRDEMYSLFKIGSLDLEDRAKGEWLFWQIAKTAVRYSKTPKYMSDEFVDLEQNLVEKYICNFSVFQSIPDQWALEQLFPVIPIHRLNEKPVHRATLVDITCDSDGEVDKFVDLKDIKTALEVHELKDGEPYYIGFLLIGAYQDTMGDLHNLFGAVHEAQVSIDNEGKVHIENAKKGERVANTVVYFGYDSEKLAKDVESRLQDQVNENIITKEKAADLLEDYKKRLTGYTYLT